MVMNPEEQANRVKEALFAGQKIQAIKLYREQTGVGLAEAKDEVEKLEATLRTTSPGLFTHPPAANVSLPGAIVVLVAVIIAFTVVMWFVLANR